MKQYKIIVEKHPDGFVAYPLGLKGIVVGQGDTYEEALSDRLIERLKHYKLVKGLSYKRLGKVMGKDPEQLTGWLSSRMRPCRRNMEFFEDFLKKMSFVSASNLHY